MDAEDYTGLSSPVEALKAGGTIFSPNATKNGWKRTVCLESYNAYYQNQTMPNRAPVERVSGNELAS